MRLEDFRKSMRLNESRLSDAREMAAADSVLDGKFLVNNTGEAYKDVFFPVLFSTIPSVSFGFEMQEGEKTIDGQVPAFTAHAYDWLTIERPPISRFFNGMKVRVVSSGPAYHKFIVHWRVSGIAFTNPVL